MEARMANKAKKKSRPDQTRDQRRLRAQYVIFLIISVIIVLSMVAMLLTS
jgi:predicted nucleic acid-binding Zn ribbon protein